MSKIDELIREFCPDGVVYKKVGDIAVVGTGKSDKKDATPDGEYPFYVRSKVIAKINSFEFDEEAIVIPGEGGIGEIFHYVTGKYALHQRAYRIHFVDNKVIPKFAYYHFMAHFKVFIMKKAVSATVTSIRKPMITDFPVPIPPLEVQKEIVNILDKFTQLEAELSAELGARRKQYEYYRQALLQFDSDVPWRSLGDVCDVKVGGEPPKSVFKIKTSEYPYPIYGNGRDVYGYTDTYVVDEDSVAISSIGANTGDIFYYSAFYTPIIRLKVLLPKDDTVLSRYIYYACSLINFNSKISSVPNMSSADVKKQKIPIPTLSQQEAIIKKLDKLEKLIKDTSIGLPAEISARRQQYEYYRTKLLTFQELSV